MDKPPSTSISWPEILLLIGIAASILLPRSVLPVGLLATGGTYLFITAFFSIRSGKTPRPAFGPITAAIFILFFGAGLIYSPAQPLLVLIITIVVTLIVQMAWMIWRNRVARR